MQVDQAGRRGKTEDLSREVSWAAKTVVITNHEKSAEVIVLGNKEGLNNSKSNGLTDVSA